jgi:3-deoxy-D-manno-octulosonic-acid transferase
VLAAHQREADRCKEIGISADRIKVSGNMKFDNKIQEFVPERALSLRCELGFAESDLI